VDRVRTLVRSDQRLGVRLIAEELNMNRETVRQILAGDLGIRKMPAKMVPQILTDVQKQRRLHVKRSRVPGQEIHYKNVVSTLFT
jgi:hypothetical protein